MYRPLLVALLCVAAFAATAHAVEFNLGSSLSSPNFRILDPQHSGFGGTASSSSPTFRLLGTIGDLSIGSSSATSFGLRSGFLYFPFVQAPTLITGTAGNSQVALSWTAALAGAGLTVGSYTVCTKPGAGSFTCQNVGLALTFNKVGLTNGTSYTFKIQANDALGNSIAESNQLIRTPISSGGGGGGGGGGGLIPSGSTGLELSGIAYPFAVVHILRDGVEIGTTVADTAARWTFRASQQPTGQRNIGVWAQDRAGRRSVTLGFVVTMNSSSTARILNIIVPPTIHATDIEINVGDAIGISGSSAPGATVRIVLEPSGRQAVSTAGPNGNGTYSSTISTIGLAAGIYTVKARTELPPGADQSTWSQLVRIGIGVPLPPDTVCGNPPDINRSGRVDLVDFSIMAFWWQKMLSAGSPNDLNCDSRLTLADFSILAFHWSGR